jgi:hypothetical protein
MDTTGKDVPWRSVKTDSQDRGPAWAAVASAAVSVVVADSAVAEVLLVAAAALVVASEEAMAVVTAVLQLGLALRARPLYLPTRSRISLPPEVTKAL